MKTSIVSTCRNDGYGGHLEFRAQKSLETMLQNFDEVVYVDWCSPGPSLVEALDKTRLTGLRHIVVTQDDLLNLNLFHLLDIPIVEVLGRNIGIRRALGDWIISSNTDVMPSSLNVDSVDSQCLYVVRKRNVPVEYFLSTENLFEACLINKDTFHREGYFGDGYSIVSGPGDFQAAHKNLWYAIRGFEEGMVYRDFADTHLMKKAMMYGFNTSEIDLPIFHLNHSGHGIDGGVMKKNSWHEFMEDFNETLSPDTWGFSNYEFFEETL